jgi:hypothetical protein
MYYVAERDASSPRFSVGSAGVDSQGVTDENQQAVDGLIQEEEDIQYDIFEFHEDDE